MVIPSMFTVFIGRIIQPSTVMGKPGPVLQSERGRNWSFKALNLTRLRFPHWESLSKSEVLEAVVTRRDEDRTRDDGKHLKDLEKFRIE